MQIVSMGDNLHEMSKPAFWKNISNCRLLKLLLRVSSVKEIVYTFRGDNSVRIILPSF